MVEIRIATNLYRAPGCLREGQRGFTRYKAILTCHQHERGHLQLGGHAAQSDLGSQNTGKPACGGLVMDERIAKEICQDLRTSRDIFGPDSVFNGQGWRQA